MPAAVPVAIVLGPEATIAGRVTHDGRPAAGVPVFAQPQNPEDGYGEAVTGVDGSYVMSYLAAGTYNVMLHEGTPREFTAVAVEGVKVKAGDHVTRIDLRLTSGAVVTGTVRNGLTRQPISETLVAAYGPARPVSSAACQNAPTDQAGVYHLRLPAGRNKLYWEGGLPMRASGGEQWVDLKEGEAHAGVDFTLWPTLQTHP